MSHAASESSDEEDVRDTIPEEFSWSPCSRACVGNGAGSASGALPAPLSWFYLTHSFDTSPSIPSELCEGTTSLPERSTFKWNPGWESHRLAPLDLSLARAVFSCCRSTQKIGRKSRSAAKLTQKCVFKEGAAHVSSPLTQTKAQYPKFPLWKVGTEGTTSPLATAGGTSPRFKALHPILVPCPLPMTSVLGELRCVTTQRLWGVSARALRNGLFLEYFCLFSIILHLSVFRKIK